jgi:hypothetical protein
LQARVNVWNLNAPGLRCDDQAVEELAGRLLRLPGFRSFTLIDTGERTVASVAVFESSEQLASASRLLAQRVVPAAAVHAGHHGEVLLRRTAWEQAGTADRGQSAAR